MGYRGNDRSRKTPKSQNNIASKIPKIASLSYLDNTGYDKKNPSWRFSICNNDNHEWPPHGTSIKGMIYTYLIAKENQTWGEIKKETHDDGKTKNHFIDIQRIDPNAQKILQDRNLIEDRIFSLRIDNKKRLFGYLRDDGVFDIIWFDPNHSICKMKK